MLGFSPIARITVGMICVTLSLLLVAGYFGLAPDGEKTVLEQRIRYAEMLSVQMSLATEQQNFSAFQAILWSAVERNDELISAGVRRRDNTVIAQYGEHRKSWGDDKHEFNTSERMSFPLMMGQRSFGRIELLFKPIGGQRFLGISKGSQLSLIIFIVCIGGVAYWYLLRRSMQYLDPTQVIPERVRAALDVLTNGVVILDIKERIVLANSAFIKKANMSEKALIGIKPSILGWDFSGGSRHETHLPWLVTLETGRSKTGVLLRLDVGGNQFRYYIVNCAPIRDEYDQLQGVMVGFDDVTEIEAKNAVLKNMLSELKNSKAEIEEQNEQLHILATRDPLTNCYNRRAFNESFQKAFEKSRANGEPLACIMTDIDHFKSVNDNHGHAVGDEIIKIVAQVLQANVRDDDVVSRYGGEEFCIMLPNIDINTAEAIAERCRRYIQASPYQDVVVASSFGVAELDSSIDVEGLINRADEALYVAKKSGRNRVAIWNKEESIAS